MNYTDIVLEARRQCDRDDDDVNDSMDNLLRLVEADANRQLRVSQNSQTGNLVGVEDKNYYPLPSDFNGMRTLRVNGKVYEYDIPERAIGAKSLVYTLVGDSLYFSFISVGDDVEMVYYKNIPPITNDEPFNWLSLGFPDVYIEGLCYQIEKFVKNFDIAEYRYKLFKTHIADINHGDQITRWSGTPLKIKPSV